MPCYDSRTSPEYIRGEYQERLDRATRVACELAKTLRALESGAKNFYLSKEAKEWIKEHEEADRKRLAEEQKDKNRKQAIARASSKLSPEERRALEGLLAQLDLDR